MTVSEMQKIFQTNIRKDKLKLDGGITEFYTVKDNSIGLTKTIGVSFETFREEDAERQAYVFNLFVNDEYINIAGDYADIMDAAEIVTKEWNKW